MAIFQNIGIIPGHPAGRQKMKLFSSIRSFIIPISNQKSHYSNTSCHTNCQAEHKGYAYINHGQSSCINLSAKESPSFPSLSILLRIPPFHAFIPSQLIIINFFIPLQPLHSRVPTAPYPLFFVPLVSRFASLKRLSVSSLPLNSMVNSVLFSSK